MREPRGTFSFLEFDDAPDYGSSFATLQERELKRFEITIEGNQRDQRFWLGAREESDIKNTSENEILATQERQDARPAAQRKVQDLQAALNTYLTDDCSKTSFALRCRLSGIGALSSSKVANEACWKCNPIAEPGVEIGWIDMTGCNAESAPA